MNNTIESIWKDAFEEPDVLMVPKLNRLYDRKSQNIVDKLQEMFAVNLWAIVAGAAIILAALAFFGAPLLGIFVASSLLLVVFVGRNDLANLEKVDKNVSSYQYLVNFDSWMKNVIATYTRIYRVLYPALFLAVALQLSVSVEGAGIISGFIEQNPDAYLVFGLPVYGVTAVLVFAALLAVFAGPIYQLDTKIVYGRTFRKLDEILADMEELRRQSAF